MITFINCNNSNTLVIFFVSHYISIIGLVFPTTYNQLWCFGSTGIDIPVNKNVPNHSRAISTQPEGMMRQAVPTSHQQAGKWN